MKAIDIEWDIDIDDALDTVNTLTDEQASELFGIPVTVWADMTPDEKYEHAHDYFRHCPGALDDFMGLPTEIDIPLELTDDEDITDWISDTYGFCIEGYVLSRESQKA